MCDHCREDPRTSRISLVNLIYGLEEENGVRATGTPEFFNGAVLLVAEVVVRVASEVR